jgi:hypothetical protein
VPEAVDAIRRGYLGLILFIVALVLIPLLVVAYHRQAQAGHATKVTVSVDASPSPSARAVAASTGAPTSNVPVIEYFQGVQQGATLRGNVQITLQTVGDVGPVIYTLSGYTSQWQAQSTPYMFAPQPLGWATTIVRNGVYTLTATPVNRLVSPLAVSFTVAN